MSAGGSSQAGDVDARTLHRAIEDVRNASREQVAMEIARLREELLAERQRSRDIRNAEEPYRQRRDADLAYVRAQTICQLAEAHFTLEGAPSQDNRKRAIGEEIDARLAAMKAASQAAQP